MNHRLATRCLLLGWWLPVVVAAQDPPTDQGRTLFESQCGSCHGPGGNGGKGANLAQPRLRRATDDASLQSIIRGGIPGTEMPSSFLSPAQVASVAAYVKTLGLVEPEAIPGDARRGEQTFASLDCQVCHMLNGRGGGVGPALDDVGARRSAAYLREALLTPEASAPADFLLVRVVTKGGLDLTGIRVNEDGFSVQLRDLAGGLHSFWKDELEILDKQWGRSPMTRYGATLTQAQLDDVVAYLVSLKADP